MCRCKNASHGSSTHNCFVYNTLRYLQSTVLSCLDSFLFSEFVSYVLASNMYRIGPKGGQQQSEGSANDGTKNRESRVRLLERLMQGLASDFCYMERAMADKMSVGYLHPGDKQGIGKGV
jgi:hypothetical protein